jgi:cellulose synthase (UDP-forming)
MSSPLDPMARLFSGGRSLLGRLGGALLLPAAERGPSFSELFPQIQFSRLKKSDILTIPLQLLWLVFLIVSSSLRLRELRSLLRAVSSRFATHGKGIRSRVVRAASAIESKELSQRVDVATDRISQVMTDFLGTGNARLKRLALFLILISIFLLSVTTPFDLTGQITLLGLMVAAAVYIRNAPSPVFGLVLAFMSMVVSSRYIWWRLTDTLNWDNPVDLIWGLLLVLAECYAYVILMMSFLQTAWPLRRPVMPMSGDPDTWPAVDVYVTTYNEPLDVVRLTVMAARELDWPADKLRVYLLDDGRREEFRAFASEVGVEYIARTDNRHAKAGNLNNALTKTKGEFVAQFDCDHVPTRAFLQMTMGWFQKDPNLSLVQTPHHFYSADPFERNLGQFKSMPNEGHLFYGLIQPGNDLWNSAFFCGSCAVLRKSALEKVGGFATDTVTEDAHTSLQMHKQGYRSAYIGLPLAAGLATDSISSHVGQRIRWGRGMAQIFRLDNPFLAKGLTVMQKIGYASAMLHFFSGGPRLIFLTAPLAFLVFHSYMIFSPALTIAVFVIPHLVLAVLATNRSQAKFRNAFWGEVHETVLSWYVAKPTTMALINPKAGKFNVTVKGGMLDQSAMDWKVATPFLVLLALNLLGIVFGIWRIWFGEGGEMGTIALNLFWAAYNVVMLGACLAVSQDGLQLRKKHRVALVMPAILRLKNGKSYRCRTSDFSEGGISLAMDEKLPESSGKEVVVSLWRGENEYSFNATIVARFGNKIGLQWSSLSVEEQAMLGQCTFGRSDAWLDWHDRASVKGPLASLWSVLETSMIGAIRFMDGLRKLYPRWAILADIKTRFLMALAVLMPKTPSRFQ